MSCVMIHQRIGLCLIIGLRHQNATRAEGLLAASSGFLRIGASLPSRIRLRRARSAALSPNISVDYRINDNVIYNMLPVRKQACEANNSILLHRYHQRGGGN